MGSHFGKLCRPSDYGFNAESFLSLAEMLELFESMPDTVKVTGSNNCDRIIELAESTFLSEIELPQNDMPEPVDVMDVEDEEEVNDTNQKNQDKGGIKEAPVQSKGSLAQSIKRIFGKLGL